MSQIFSKIRTAIANDPFNVEMHEKGYKPLFSISAKSKVIIIGQAPGIRAQTSGIPWDDKSGETLQAWLGISAKQFYNEDIFGIIPMDFYFPGKGKSGDLPPRKGFAEKWHPQLLEAVESEYLVILIGQYAQKFYLKKKMQSNLTNTVKAYKEYLPDNFFPLPHPSPRNNIWMAKNPWFKDEVIPELQKTILQYL